jgi:signal transduction histidine kinase
MLGNAEFLGQARELTADSREAVGDLLASARLFAQILCELRAVSRALGADPDPPPRLEAVPLAPMAHAAVRAAGPRAARADVRLRCEAEEPLAAVANAELLRHVLDDLVDNAIRNAPARTEVLVRAQRRDARALLEVADRRLPPASLEHLFDLEIGDLASGRRLALVFARLSCELMGGALRAERDGGGVALTVELPAA